MSLLKDVERAPKDRNVFEKTSTFCNIRGDRSSKKNTAPPRHAAGVALATGLILLTISLAL